MSFTSEVKDELARVMPACPQCEKATLAALVRIEGTLFVSGPARYRVEIATDAPANRVTSPEAGSRSPAHIVPVILRQAHPVHALIRTQTVVSCALPADRTVAKMPNEPLIAATEPWGAVRDALALFGLSTLKLR